MGQRLVKETEGQWAEYWNYWKRFCSIYKINIFHASEDNLLLYSEYRKAIADNGGGTIRNQIYGIRDALIKQNQSINVDRKSMGRLHTWLDGRKSEKPPGKGSDLITAEILGVWWPFMPKRIYNNCIFRGALSFTHNTIRRNDELSQKTIGGIKMGHLLWENGTIYPEDTDTYAVITIPRSKGNKFGALQLAPIFCIHTTSKICCFCEIKRIYRRRRKDIAPSTPLFQLDNGRILTYNALRNQVQKLCDLTGYDKSKLTLHGLRSGGNYDAKMRGISGENRELLAGWKSSKTRKIYDCKINKLQLLSSMKLEMDIHHKFVKNLEKKKRKKLRKKKKKQAIEN